jgi:hypothetical protein
MDKEGYSLRRRDLLKTIMEYIIALKEPTEATILKEFGLNDADFRFVLDRLFNLGLCYFPDCGVHSVDEYQTSVSLAKKRFSNPEDQETLKTEIDLLCKDVTCMIGMPIKLPLHINMCDKNAWITNVDKITELHANSYIMHNDELLFVVSQQQEAI